MNPRLGVAAAAALAGLAVASAGCVRELEPVRVAPGVSSSPSEPWKPAEPPPAAPATPPVNVPADLLATAQSWTLDNLVDLALRTSPRTRAAWERARSAAAALGSEKGTLYPSIGLLADTTRVRGSAVGGLFTYQQGSYGAQINMTYLLLDFGGRSASIEATRQALVAADWLHNAAIQDVVLGVQQAYYQYVLARALREAQQSNVNEAQTTLDVADGRRVAGVSTVADVLQARTVLSQARLALATTEGQLQALKGTVAVSVGLPANYPYELVLPEDTAPVQELSGEVDRLIEDAQARRPDLAAARARVLEADARVRQLHSQLLPSLATNVSTGVIAYTGGSSQDTYNLALLLRVPLFNGLSLQYNKLQAEAEAGVARSDAETLAQDIVAQVWTDYYGVKTAETRITTSESLLQDASQSYDVSNDRYRAGVGTILDVIAAQRGLDNARAEVALARADWHQALARLAHDTGTLWGKP